MDNEVSVATHAAHISLWALYVSGGALFISACVFALELRRWFDEGVRLAVSIMPDAQIIGGGQRDPHTYLSVTVTNRGSAPTTITNMYLFNYPNYVAAHVPNWLNWRVERLRPDSSFVISIGAPGPIPYLLEPGRMWNGRAIQTAELEKMIDDGRLYVGIYCSHANKPTFKQARRTWKPSTDAK